VKVSVELLPLLTYVLVTTFTPGPNNITSTSAGVRLGIKKSLPYLFGIATGFFAIMLCSGLFSYYLKAAYAPLAVFMKWLGFAYMLWLCASLFKKPKEGEVAGKSFSYGSGLVLQFLNPKVILYGITLFGAFSGILLTGWTRVLTASLGLTAVGFAAILSWCAGGSALSRVLRDGRRRFAFNLLLAALLLYSAISLVLE
jgi:cysteine/O-acetylserine efflux protein